nr:scf e3 ubiquitin ligase complex f-box protein grra [Quercus suber]
MGLTELSAREMNVEGIASREWSANEVLQLKDKSSRQCCWSSGLSFGRSPTACLDGYEVFATRMADEGNTLATRLEMVAVIWSPTSFPNHLLPALTKDPFYARPSSILLLDTACSKLPPPPPPADDDVNDPPRQDRICFSPAPAHFAQRDTSSLSAVHTRHRDPMQPAMARSRRLQRVPSTSSNSSSSTSPERGEDDNDSFTLQANDSQSSLGMDISARDSEDAELQREYEERCRVSPVQRLPAELLISIFSRLSAPKDLQNCLLVSQDWARNSVALLWHRPAMNRWDSVHSVVRSVRKTNKFFAYQDLVKRLNVSTLASQVSDGTLYGMRDCKRIERLTLTSCTKLTDVSLNPLIEGNRSLLALDVTGLDQLTDQTMMTVANNCLRLQGLNITGCKKISDASISAIAKNCRHLKRLKFNNCTQLTDTSILTVAANSVHLLEIDLYGLQHVEGPAVTALLTSCMHLREVRLAHCSRINDSAFLDIPNNIDMPIMFDSLRILDLTDCSELGDKGVERIIQSCPRLRNLILAKCRLITDRSVLAITKLGKNLHYIHLGHCQRITDVSVEALAKACNRIRYIDLACCSNLTDNSITRLAGLPKLKRIGLVKCAGITDHSIYALAMGEVNKHNKKAHNTSVLERVHLSYCTLLTLDLTHLSLTGVQAFLRDELLAFCREAPVEFNEHQRDVFCVFSGNGVERLREFLNERQAAADQARRQAPSEAPSSVDEDMEDDDLVMDGNANRNGSSVSNQTPAINVNVASQFEPGATPVVPMPSPGSNALFAQVILNRQMHRQPPPWPPQPIQVPPQHFSSSAPASTNLAAAQAWAVANAQQQRQQQQQQQQQPQQQQQNPPPQVSGDQHVTGMMGAAMLEDLDELDEVFGEESEVMDRD